MRKNINKIIAIAIGISTMSGSIMPVFAADTTQSSTAQNTSTSNVQTNNVQTKINGKTVLTLDDAIKSAISISNTLALDDKNINYQDNINDIKDKQDDYKIDNQSSTFNSDDQNFDKDTSDLKLKELKQQGDFDEDILRKNLTDAYNNIVTEQMQISMVSEDLKVKNEQYDNQKLKVKLGSDLETNLKSTELVVLQKQNDLNQKQNDIKDKEYSFKALTGKDVTLYTLEQDIKFEPLKIDGSIDEYLDNLIESYLSYGEQIVKLNKDYYDNDYEDEKKASDKAIGDTQTAITNAQTAITDAEKSNSQNQDPGTQIDLSTLKSNLSTAETNYATALGNRITYLTTKKGINSDETTLAEEKRKFKDTLKGYYTQLRASEDKINYDKKNIELINENLSNYKLKYDLGMTTEADYETQVVSSEQSNLDLRSEIINYNIIKQEIQKPWISITKSTLTSESR